MSSFAANPSERKFNSLSTFIRFRPQATPQLNSSVRERQKPGTLLPQIDNPSTSSTSFETFGYIIYRSLATVHDDLLLLELLRRVSLFYSFGSVVTTLNISYSILKLLFIYQTVYAVSWTSIVLWNPETSLLT